MFFYGSKKWSRIHGHVSDDAKKIGTQKVLTKSEVKCNLEEWYKDIAMCGFPLKDEDLVNTVQAITVCQWSARWKVVYGIFEATS